MINTPNSGARDRAGSTPIIRISIRIGVATSALLLAALSAAAPSSAATAGTSRPSTAGYAKGCDGLIYDAACLHVLAGHTFGTTTACYNYVISHKEGSRADTECETEQPSGDVYADLFDPYCTVGETIQWCWAHHEP